MRISPDRGPLPGYVSSTTHIAALTVARRVVGEVLLRVVVGRGALATFNLLGDAIFASGLFLSSNKSVYTYIKSRIVVVHIARVLHSYIVLMPPVFLGIFVFRGRVNKVAPVRVGTYLVFRRPCTMIDLGSVSIGADPRRN